MTVQAEGFKAAKPPYLHTLHLQLHVVLPRRLAIFPLLPAVAVLSVLHLLPVVQNHGPILWPGGNTNRGAGSSMVMEECLSFTGKHDQIHTFLLSNCSLTIKCTSTF